MAKYRAQARIPWLLFPCRRVPDLQADVNRRSCRLTGRVAPVCGAGPSTVSNAAMNLVTTTGNATLIVYGGKPLLASDP